jgi:hypothetical protein
LRIWFSSFTGTIPQSSDGERGGLTIYNCQNMNFRGNEWRFGQSVGTTSTNVAFKIRDSTSLTVNCDTVIATGTGSQVWWFFNAVDYNHHVDYSVDSSYYQLYTQEWHQVMGSWTYTTFVTADGFDYRSNTAKADSSATTTFNHCNFISTTGASTVFGPLAYDNSFYTWPVTINTGNVMVFKNNIIARANNNPDVADNSVSPNYNRRKALVRWGLVGGLSGSNCGDRDNPCANKDVARKITTDWNLYAANNTITGRGAGQLSIGWRDFHDFTDSTSRPGHGKSFKTAADAGAAGTAAAAASSYDSLSVSSTQAGVQWAQYITDSTASKPGWPSFDYVWLQGTRLDLRLGAGSVARLAGEGGLDIGAVQSTASSLTACAATDTCNSIVLTHYATTLPNGSDAGLQGSMSALGSNPDTLVQLRFINSGTQTLTISSPISYSPAGSYTASSAGLTLTAGQVGYLGVRFRIPSFDIPQGTYYLDVFLTTTDVGNPTYKINVTINKSVYSVE